MTLRRRLRLHVITATLPPQLDGIGDYTANLAAELAKSVSVKILTAQGQEYTSIQGVEIEPTFSIPRPRSVCQIARRVSEDKPDWVLLQYNPFSYGRWGLNLHLPLVIREIKHACPKTRFALMVHEPFVPPTNWKFATMSTWQAWQFWMLGRNADAVFFSTEFYLRKFGAWFPGKLVQHLPVGSGIPLISAVPSETRAQLNIDEGTWIMGLFGTAHPSRLLHWTRSAAMKACGVGLKVKMLYIGPHGRIMHETLGNVPLLDLGPMSAAEVSRYFGIMDVFLSPFRDGVTTRRSSLMTALQHGLPIVSTCSTHTDKILLEENERAILLAKVNAPEEFNTLVIRLLTDDDLRKHLSYNARALYQREFAWNRTASRLLNALKH